MLAKKLTKKEELLTLKLKEVMEGIGFNTKTENTKNTPKRILNVWKWFMQNEGKDCSTEFSVTFPAEGFDGILIVKNIRITNLCIHHALPFLTSLSVAVRLKDRVPGLSKYARTIELLGNRFSMQEQISAMCMQAIKDKLNPAGALVYAEAVHSCIACRVKSAMDSQAITIQTYGEFDNSENRNFVLNLLK